MSGLEAISEDHIFKFIHALVTNLTQFKTHYTVADEVFTASVQN